MLKIIQDHSIKLKRRALWLFGVLLATMTAAAAQIPADTPIPIMNSYGMTAPFLISWLPIWAFAVAGGIGSLFFKIEAIDKNFRFLLIAKPFLGVFGALALCLVLASNTEPPAIALGAYAFIAALLSAPILQGLLTMASLPKNQAGLFNAINPLRFKVVVEEPKSDKGDKS